MIRSYLPVLMAPGVLALSGFLGGCQMGERTEYGQINPAPLVYDEALALREWPRTSVYYVSGDTVAGPVGPQLRWQVGEANQPNHLTRTRGAIVADPLLFIGNTLLLPAWMIANPPTEQRVYQAHVLGPTYTAAVPPDAVNAGMSYAGRDLQEWQEEQERPRRERRERRTRRRAPDPVVPLRPPTPIDPDPPEAVAPDAPPTQPGPVFIPLQDLLERIEPRE